VEEAIENEDGAAAVLGGATIDSDGSVTGDRVPSSDVSDPDAETEES